MSKKTTKPKRGGKSAPAFRVLNRKATAALLGTHNKWLSDEAKVIKRAATLRVGSSLFVNYARWEPKGSPRDAIARAYPEMKLSKFKDPDGKGEYVIRLK